MEVVVKTIFMPFVNERKTTFIRRNTKRGKTFADAKTDNLLMCSSNVIQYILGAVVSQVFLT